MNGVPPRIWEGETDSGIMRSLTEDQSETAKELYARQPKQYQIIAYMAWNNEVWEKYHEFKMPKGFLTICRTGVEPAWIEPMIGDKQNV